MHPPSCAGRLLYLGSLVIVFAVVSLIFRKSVYQIYSQAFAPHRDIGPVYVLIYLVEPLSIPLR